MTTSSVRKHAGPGPATDQPLVPEPAFAERARTLLHLGRVGSLSTLSRKQAGFPFGSVMPYGLDDGGRPIFLISTMAMHTPVSYTHLDVYKRQDLNDQCALLCCILDQPGKASVVLRADD